MPSTRPFTLFVSACVISAAVALSPRVSPHGLASQDPAPQTAQQPQPAPTAPLHVISVNVTDEKGSFVKGLGREAFAVYDGKQQREVVTFEQPDAPATVGIILDTSGSMYANSGKTTRIGNVREALRNFLSDGNPSNEYFLVAFNDSPQMLVAGTTDAGEIFSALDKVARVRGRGLTALYDALYVALNRRGGGSRHARRVLLLVSDGQDNKSDYSFNEVKRAVVESDVTLFVVGLFDPHDESSLGYGGRTIMKELAEASGGMAFFARGPRELEGALGMVADAVRSQYRIGFAPAAAAKKNGWHDLKIKLSEQRDERGKKLKLSVHARKGFYEAASAR